MLENVFLLELEHRAEDRGWLYSKKYEKKINNYIDEFEGSEWRLNLLNYKTTGNTSMKR